MQVIYKLSNFEFSEINTGLNVYIFTCTPLGGAESSKTSYNLQFPLSDHG